MPANGMNMEAFRLLGHVEILVSFEFATFANIHWGLGDTCSSLKVDTPILSYHDIRAGGL